MLQTLQVVSVNSASRFTLSRVFNAPRQNQSPIKNFQSIQYNSPSIGTIGLPAAKIVHGLNKLITFIGLDFILFSVILLGKKMLRK